MKMHWRLSFEYLATKHIVESIAEVLGLGMKLGVGGFWAEGHFSLSISLSIKEGAQNGDVMEDITKIWFFEGSS